VSQWSYLPQPLAHHTATRLNNGKVLIAGGSQSPDEQLADVELFDPATGAVTAAAPLLVARHDHTATLLSDGRVLVVGGYNAVNSWIADAEVYDPIANTWTVVSPIYPHGVGHTATLLRDGQVLVVGGCIGSGVCTGRAEIFLPQLNNWVEAASLPSDRASHSAHLLNDGRVLIVGGGSAAGPPAGGDALLYNLRTNSWSATGPMITPRLFPQSARLPDGRILVAGGTELSNAPVNATASVEIFDPGSNTWAAAGSLSQPRFAFLLAALPDGHMMAVGGAREYGDSWTESSMVREIEMYDPQTERWHTAGELPRPAAYLAGAALLDSRIWVSGGQGGNSAERFWLDSWLITPTFCQP
jgi:N-acetylneuraminic acid mutarotase